MDTSARENDASITENIKVFIRERPFCAHEKTAQTSEQPLSGLPPNKVVTGKEDGTVSHRKSVFKFNAFFGEESTQEQIYTSAAQPIVESCLRGYSGTIFAYGSTGSGKTYTMLGSREEHSNRGILPRCMEQVSSGFPLCP